MPNIIIKIPLYIIRIRIYVRKYIKLYQIVGEIYAVDKHKIM